MEAFRAARQRSSMGGIFSGEDAVTRAHHASERPGASRGKGLPRKDSDIFSSESAYANEAAHGMREGSTTAEQTPAGFATKEKITRDQAEQFGEAALRPITNTSQRSSVPGGIFAEETSEELKLVKQTAMTAKRNEGKSFVELALGVEENAPAGFSARDKGAFDHNASCIPGGIFGSNQI